MLLQILSEEKENIHHSTRINQIQAEKLELWNDLTWP